MYCASGLNIRFSNRRRRRRPAESKRLGAWVRRGVKLAVGVSVAIGLGWSPMRAMLVPASVEAVVNARILFIRAPIEGYLDEAPGVASQWSAADAAPTLVIANPDADRAPLASVTRELGDIEDRIEANARERTSLKGALAELDAQVAAFRSARLAVLDKRLAGLSAEADAASLRAGEADAQWRRTRALRAVGAAAVATEQHWETEARATALAAQSAAFKASETQVERDALAKGAFVGDEYNDTPNSDQTARDLRLKLDALEGNAATLARAKARLDGERQAEAALYARRARSTVALPPVGRVFEALAARGEHVAKGQELMRIMDCASAIVSADVEESVYNRLRIGEKATFAPADGSAPIVGEIVNLTGANAAPGDYAISPASLHKSPFYVTVALPQAEAHCAVGRTGAVTFSNN